MAWFAAQVLELFEWRAGTREMTSAQYEARLQETAYLLMMVPEELLEMSGSLMFAYALAHLARTAP